MDETCELLGADFPEVPPQFADYMRRNDKAGAARYLRKLARHELQEQVLRAGYSTISEKCHGRGAVIAHIINQMIDNNHA